MQSPEFAEFRLQLPRQKHNQNKKNEAISMLQTLFIYTVER